MVSFDIEQYFFKVTTIFVYCCSVSKARTGIGLTPFNIIDTVEQERRVQVIHVLYNIVLANMLFLLLKNVLMYLEHVRSILLRIFNQRSLLLDITRHIVLV